MEGADRRAEGFKHRTDIAVLDAHFFRFKDRDVGLDAKLTSFVIPGELGVNREAKHARVLSWKAVPKSPQPAQPAV